MAKVATCARLDKRVVFCICSSMQDDRPLDFWVQVESDDGKHYVIVSKWRRFDDAMSDYKRLLRSSRDMRLIMRWRAHIYRKFVPERLQEAARAAGERWNDD